MEVYLASAAAAAAAMVRNNSNKPQPPPPIGCDMKGDTDRCAQAGETAPVAKISTPTHAAPRKRSFGEFSAVSSPSYTASSTTSSWRSGDSSVPQHQKLSLGTTSLSSELGDNINNYVAAEGTSSDTGYENYDTLDSDSDYDSDESEEETKMIQELVSSSFAKGLQANILSRVGIVAPLQMPTSDNNKRTRYSMVEGAKPPPVATISLPKSGLASVEAIRALRERLATSQSAPNIIVSAHQRNRAAEEARQLQQHQQQKQEAAAAAKEAANETSPDQYLRTLLQRKGLESRTVPASELDDSFFHRHQDEASRAKAVASYDMALVQAVRIEDVGALRALLKEDGRTMQCGNKFGESIVHTACRCGSAKVLQFLLDEAGVSAQVCCDSGRTPLHDACWSSEPRFRIAGLLLDRHPDLLHVADKRGFPPLAYVPRGHWSQWRRFLDARGAERLAPRDLKKHFSSREKK